MFIEKLVNLTRLLANRSINVAFFQWLKVFSESVFVGPVP